MSSYLNGAKKFSIDEADFSQTENNHHAPVHYTSSSSNNTYSGGSQHNQIGYTGQNGTIHFTPPQHPARTPPCENQSERRDFFSSGCEEVLQESSPPISSSIHRIGVLGGPSSEQNDNHNHNGTSHPGPILAAPSAPPLAQQAPLSSQSIQQPPSPNHPPQAPNSGHSHPTPSASTIDQEWQAYQADAQAGRAGILPPHLIPYLMAQYISGGNGFLPSTGQYAPPQRPAHIAQGGAVPANQPSTLQQPQPVRPEISPVQHSEALPQANPGTPPASLNTSETPRYNDNVHAPFPPPPNPEAASGPAQSPNGFRTAGSAASPVVTSSSGNAPSFAFRTQGLESDGEDARRISGASIRSQDVELRNARPPSVASSHTAVDPEITTSTADSWKPRPTKPNLFRRMFRRKP